MIWIGLVVGLIVGGVIKGFEGAVIGGFLGWLAGVVIKSRNSANAESAPSPVPVPTAAPMRETVEARVQRLEKTVARLEARLARLEPEGAGVEAEEEKTTPTPIFTPIPPPIPADAAPRVPEKTVSDTNFQKPSPTPIIPSPPNPLWAWITGGNTIARVGILILFFGFAFLLKYAADHSMLPVELRVAGVAAGAIALLVFGWRLREKRPAYALGLQGAGVAVLYLTTFASLRLWHLIPGEAAFVLLALIAVFAAFLAIKQDSMALAVIGAGGGFLAPILASTGGGSHVMLFSYYLILNLGIAAVALYKAWRPLNLTGFLFTFFIGLAWGMRDYKPQHFDTTEPFLIAFFVLYVVIAILFARKQAPELKRFADGTVVFGTPLAAFGLQAGLTKGMEFALAWSSLAAAAFYIVLATFLHRTRRESFRLLSEAFLALGVVFATLAIPLALDARWTSASWALEGAAVVWVGVRQRRTLARAFGLLLQLIAAIAYWEGYRRLPGAIPLVDAAFVGAILLSGAALWTHRVLLNHREDVTKVESGLVPVLFAWGLLWWSFAGIHEIETFVAAAYKVNAAIAFFAATAAVLVALARRWEWVHAAVAARLLLPVLFLFAALVIVWKSHPFADFGWLVWPFAIAVHFAVLRKLAPEESTTWYRALHTGGVWLVAALGAHEMNWLAAKYTAHGTAWSVAAVILVGALLVLWIASRAADDRWPVVEEPHAYRANAVEGMALAFVAWSLYANATHDGSSAPLPYLPLLNALDLGHILIAIAIGTAVMTLRRMEIPSALASRGAAITAAVIAFIWLNGVLLRSLHHWADIPYNLHAMQRSVLVQASLSIFWSIIALTVMVYATRKAWRAIWMVGAALMAVVVAKLFLIDLSNVGGIERIISFIAVGVLMLLVGYFSPVPPRKAAA